MRATRIALVALMVLLASAPMEALAGNEDYPQDYKIYWKPTFGTWDLTKGSANPQKKTVFETFGWGTSVSLLQVDAPRTPSMQGTYEHELRFNDETGNGAWCTTSGQTFSIIAMDLPPTQYHDDTPDFDEFTWGMRTYQLQQDHVYDIKFNCWSTNNGSSTEFNHSGQLGHCHIPCSQITTFPDETVKPIPSSIGSAPGQAGNTKSYTVDGSFDDNPSFESTPSNWTVQNGTKNYQCPGVGGPYHGSCHVRVVPNTGAQAKLQMTFNPGPAATGTNYNEFIFRCPPAPNPDGTCQVRVYIQALNSSGSVIVETGTTPVTVSTSSSAWHSLRVTRTTAWPSTTVSWRFGIAGGNGDTFDADYHQQHYDLPR